MKVLCISKWAKGHSPEERGAIVAVYCMRVGAQPALLRSGAHLRMSTTASCR
jgi:hypothetical protein